MGRICVVLAVALALPATALAKGAERVRIVGPGLAKPIVIVNDGGDDGWALLRALTDDSGFYNAIFKTRPDFTRKHQPPGRLGVAYTATYRLVAPAKPYPVVRQLLYPFATPRPLAYVAPGQPIASRQRTHGGWIVADSHLRTLLVSLGVARR